MTPRERVIEETGRRLYASLLVRVNQTLTSIGKKPIIPIQDYVTHFQEIGFLESFFGGIQHVPENVLNVRFSVPNHPFFPFMFKRKGGPFTEDYLGALQRYVPAALRMIHVTPAVWRAKPLLRHLPANAKQYFEQFLAEATGRPTRVDHGFNIDPAVMRVMEGFRNVTNRGLILGNIRTVLMQPSAMALGVARRGLLWQMRGQLRALTPEGWQFAQRYSRELAVRRRVGTLLETKSWLDRTANFALEFMDQYQVAATFLAESERLVKLGVGPERAFILADIGAIRDNASMRRILKSPVLRSRAISSIVMPLQTFAVNFRQNFLIDTMIKRAQGGNVEASKWLARLIVSVVTTNFIYKELTNQEPFQLTDLVPGFIGIIPANVIAKAVESEGRFIPPASKLLKILANLGLSAFDSTDNERARRLAETWPEIVQSIFMFIPGGNQVLKSYKVTQAVALGGVYTKDGKLKFPVSGITESAKAILLGPYGTSAGQEYLEARGVNQEALIRELKKADPRSSRARELRERLNAVRTRLRGSGRTQRQAPRQAPSSKPRGRYRITLPSAP